MSRSSGYEIVCARSSFSSIIKKGSERVGLKIMRRQIEGGCRETVREMEVGGLYAPG
jgi:hypothetical protein